jgi:hypothetical protein
MKTKKPFRSLPALRPALLFAAWAAALLLGACANSGKAQRAAPVERSPAVSPAAIAAIAVLPESGLDRPLFQRLSPETLGCLEALSKAFAAQDRAYLLSQGEENYEAEIRPYYDEGSYLAMLYRAGAYAAEGPGDSGGRPFLEPGEILGIEYLDWEEQGPMLLIRGRLVTKTGTLPCRIVLAWRLAEPKILGAYP